MYMYTIARGDRWRRSGGCQIDDMLVVVVVVATTLATTAFTKHLYACVCERVCVCAYIRMCICVYVYVYI